MSKSMSDEQSDVQESHSRFSLVTADCVVAVFTFILGLAMMMDSYRVGSGWSDGGLEAAYFPFRVGLAISIVSVLLFLKLIITKKKDKSPFSEADGLIRVLKILAPTIAYVAIIQFTGIYVASALFVGYFIAIVGKQGALRSLSISLGAPIFLFAIFEVFFSMPLPKGYLERLLGY